MPFKYFKKKSIFAGKCKVIFHNIEKFGTCLLLSFMLKQNIDDRNQDTKDRRCLSHWLEEASSLISFYMTGQ